MSGLNLSASAPMALGIHHLILNETTNFALPVLEQTNWSTKALDAQQSLDDSQAKTGTERGGP